MEKGNLNKQKENDQNLEKIENENFILDSNGAFNKKSKSINKPYGYFIFLAFFTYFALSPAISMYHFASSGATPYFMSQNETFLISTFLFAALYQIFALRMIFGTSNKAKKISLTIGLNIALIVALSVFTIFFSVSSFPAVSVVSLCFAFRPWYKISNILIAIICGLFFGIHFYLFSLAKFQKEKKR